MSQTTSHTITTGQIQAENGEYYPDSVYQETSKAVGNQQWVADHWAKGDLPTHSTKRNRVVLRTTTENFRGYQYRDGRGLLKHYSHIQAIRTLSGLIIGDSSCWSRGWAKCNYPRQCEAKIDLTTLKEKLRGEPESIWDIEDVQDEKVRFESGRAMTLETYEWVEGRGTNILGT